QELDAGPAGGGTAPPPVARTLPVPPTRLIGRERQLAEILALFGEEGARLVTLTGPGGVGKTRLAIGAAEQLSDAAVWVDLAPLAEPELVPQSVAEALGLDEHPAGPAAAVAEHLARRSALLVLDNFERLLAAAPFVADLLARAPGLRVLVTSRQALHVRAEHELAVPPLPG